ncbi:hypothetical protein L6R29_09110 [Myxococcota bacterium]|nr:hypothetical protein [Myxococcota bacterium]
MCSNTLVFPAPKNPDNTVTDNLPITNLPSITLLSEHHAAFRSPRYFPITTLLSDHHAAFRSPRCFRSLCCLRSLCCFRSLCLCFKSMPKLTHTPSAFNLASLPTAAHPPQ